jgi:hypothetical protein
MSIQAEYEAVNREGQVEVIIKKIDIPFFNLVWFLVQVAIAAVPAAIIVSIFWVAIFRILFSG